MLNMEMLWIDLKGCLYYYLDVTKLDFVETSVKWRGSCYGGALLLLEV